MIDKKDQIIDAAKNLFARQGYAKTSVDDISQAVGMQKSSLYYYFKNKEDLFMCSFKNEWESHFKLFETEAVKYADPAEKIIEYIKQSLNYYEKVVVDHKIPVKVLIETRNLYRSFVNQVNQGGIVFYKSCIDQGMAQNTFGDCDAQKVAESLFMVKYSIQYDQLSIYLHSYPTEKDWANIRENILYTVRLILDGIRLCK